MNKIATDRLIFGASILLALPVVIYSTPWAHTAVETALDMLPWAHFTAEASLNLSWILLALAAFIHWKTPNGRQRRANLPAAVNLVFVLVLLFPAISASDDVAQPVLNNDASSSQLIVASLENDRHVQSTAGFAWLPCDRSISIVLSLRPTSDSVYEPAHRADVATPGETTGNHSPPFC